MTKIGAIIRKNFKMILRSKASGLIILIGPMLVMLIIGLAFNSESGQRINVGYYLHEDNELTNSFVEKITSAQYKLEQFHDIDLCKEAIGSGDIHICVVFPADFRIENKRVNQIDFLVDNSKVNFFRTVLDSIESDFNERAQELTTGLTKELLDKLNQTSEEITNKSQIITTLKDENTKIAEKITDTESRIEKMKLGFDMDDLDLDDLEDFGSDIDNLKGYAEDAIDETEDLIGDVEDFIDDVNMSGSDEDDLEDILNTSQARIDLIKIRLNDSSSSSTDKFEGLMDDLKDNLGDLENNLNLATSSRQKSMDNLKELKERAANSKLKIEAVEETFNAITSNIQNTEVTSLSSIVKPIKKNIKPVITEESQLNFYFPYLVILIMMFIGILLSSTLVGMEKTSRAYFRNFVTPTGDMTFIISKYLTSMFFITIQLIFVMLIFVFYFKKDILQNLQVTSLILFVAASIFTLIGMIIGNIFNSNETNMLASITASSIMLFISDLVFPLERMPEYMANIAQIYNPFYVCSDLLRKSMVHNLSIFSMQRELIILGLTLGLLGVIVILSYKLMKKHFLLRFAGYMARRDVKKKIAIEDYMKIYNKMKSVPDTLKFDAENNKKLSTLKEMIDFIGKLDKEGFKKYVNNKQNLIGDWISNAFEYERLATHLYKTKSKNKTLKLLKKAQKEFEKFDKNISKPNKKEKKN